MAQKIITIAITAQQLDLLKSGKPLEVDGKIYQVINGKPCRMVTTTTSKPRFSMFYVPHRSTALVCQLSEADMKKAIAQYLLNPSKPETHYVEAYKRNGEKDNNGELVKLEKQIINGTARVVRFRVTKDINIALVTDGIRQTYVDENGEPWYVAKDIEETTQALNASNLKIDTDTQVNVSLLNLVSF